RRRSASSVASFGPPPFSSTTPRRALRAGKSRPVRVSISLSRTWPARAGCVSAREIPRAVANRGLRIMGGLPLHADDDAEAAAQDRATVHRRGRSLAGQVVGTGVAFRQPFGLGQVVADHLQLPVPAGQ